MAGIAYFFCAKDQNNVQFALGLLSCLAIADQIRMW